MYPQSMFQSKDKKNIKIFQLKIVVFAAEKKFQYIVAC